MSHKLADLMKKMQKEHGPGSFKVASDTDPYCPRIPTGIFSLDYAMGGGIPIGRTSMFYGKRSAGKSAACAKTAANAQRLCRKCYGRVITQDKEVTVERKTVDLITGKMQVTEEKIVKKTPVDCVNKCRVVVEGKKVFPGRMQVIWVDAEGCVSEDNEILDPMTGRIATVGEWVRGQGCNVESLAGDRLAVVPISSKCDSGIRSVLRIFTATGWVEVTPNHPLLVWRRGQTWIPAEEVQTGDYIARPRWSSFEGGQHPDEEVAGLLGYMLGDGGVAESASSPTITNKGDPEIMLRVMELVSYFGCKTKKYDDRHYRIIGEDSNGSSGANKGRNGVKNWFRERGMLVPCYEKFLPEDVFQWDNISIGKLLVGLFMTDGTINTARASAAIGLTSRRLILQVRHLLSRLGILAHLDTYRYKNPHHRDQYRLTINGVPNLQRFRGFVPLYGEKGAKLDAWCLSERKQTHYPDDFYLPGYKNAMWSHRGAFENESDVWWDKVVKIEPRGEKHCWDFGVPPHKNFVVNDFVGHNTFTPDFYMKFGVDCDDLMLATPDYGEAAVDMVDSAIRLRAVDLIIVDSIAHLTPLKEREGSTEDSLVAVQARLVNRAMRQWTSSLNEVESNKENDCAILLVNQIREKMGGFYTAEVRPGGMGQAFATSLDIHLWQKDFKYDSTGRPLWMTSKFIVEKNRVSVPKMEGTYRMCLLDHPGRLAGDTWDDEAVADAVLDRGFATFDDKGGVTVIGRPFASSDEFRAEIAKREDFYYEAREAVLNFMIYQPSDGKLAEKKKKGDKDGKDDKGGKDDAQEE